MQPSRCLQSSFSGCCSCNPHRFCQLAAAAGRLIPEHTEESSNLNQITVLQRWENVGGERCNICKLKNAGILPLNTRKESQYSQVHKWEHAETNVLYSKIYRSNCITFKKTQDYWWFGILTINCKNICHGVTWGISTSYFWENTAKMRLMMSQ